MASEIKSDKLSPSTGTSLQIGDASDTITIPTGATFTITDGLGVGGGGTGLTSFAAGDVLYATGTTTLAKLAKGSAEEVLSMNSGATAPEWTTAAATAGGTGQTSFTAGDLLYANSTTTLTKLGKGTGLQGLQTNSGATAPEWANSPQSLMTAAGDIIYASGANTLAKLAKGSDDEVLTLASGVPSWASAGGGAWNLLDTTTISTDSGTVTVGSTSIFTTTYKVYKIIMSNCIPVTNSVAGHCRLKIGGSIITSANYWVTTQRMYSGSTSWSGYNSEGNSDKMNGLIGTSVSNETFEGVSAELTLWDPASTSNNKQLMSVANAYDASSQAQITFGLAHLVNTAICDGVIFYFETGDVASGVWRTYGISAS